LCKENDEALPGITDYQLIDAYEASKSASTFFLLMDGRELSLLGARSDFFVLWGLELGLELRSPI